MKSLSKLSDTMNNTTFRVPAYPLIAFLLALFTGGILIGMQAPSWLSMIIIATLIISGLVIILTKSKDTEHLTGDIQ